MQEITRRKTILGAVGAGAVALAGCVSNGGQGEENTGDGNGGDENDDDNNRDGAIQNSTIERVGSDCAGPNPGAVTVALDEETCLIDGTIDTPTPCYLPAFEEVTYEEGTLSVTVAIEGETDEDGEPLECVTCEGKVLYQSSVELAYDTAVETVEVTHESGQQFTIDESEFGDGRPTIVSTSIETTRADTRDGETSTVHEFEHDDDRVTVEGSIPTDTPHYEAVILESSIRQRQLQLAIGVESTLDEDEAGTLPTGIVEYEAEINLENGGALDSARIDHPDSSHGMAWDSASEGAIDEGDSGGEGSDAEPDQRDEGDDSGADDREE